MSHNRHRVRPFSLITVDGVQLLLVGWIGMRGILTLAAAGSVPRGVPGRDAILAVALLVTLGTLLIQGTTIGWLTRRLRFDLTAERAQDEEMQKTGQRIVAEVAGETRDLPSPGQGQLIPG